MCETFLQQLDYEYSFCKILVLLLHLLFDVASWIPAWKCLQTSFHDIACDMGGSPKPTDAQRNMALSPKSLPLLSTPRPAQEEHLLVSPAPQGRLQPSTGESQKR